MTPATRFMSAAATVQPYPWQEPDIAALAEMLTRWDVALDSSDPGTGKTWKTCFLARMLGLDIAVVCPKAILRVWEEVAAKVGVRVTHVTNYEKLRIGKTPLGKWASKRKFQWTLPANCLLVIDEVHRAKGADTQNCRMVMAIRDCGVKALLLSATAAQNPLEMKALGYLLGLHNGRDFLHWCKDNGCRKGYFGGYEYAGGPEGLTRIWASMRSRTVRTRVADLGDAFPANRIETLPLETGEADAIDRAILEELNELASGAETELVAGLRARQKAEYLKAKAIGQLAEDLVAEGRSVAIFVCFRETLRALEPVATKLNGEDVPCRIQGGQSEDERQAAIDAFQQDRARVILCMIQAGGVGLSLHDVNGTFPRVALICPTFSATDLRQSLGRIHRAGAKSAAQQFIVFAAGTIEETVRSRVEGKLANIDLLNDGDLAYLSPEKSSENLRRFSEPLRRDPVEGHAPEPFEVMSTTTSSPAPERPHAPLSPSGLANVERCPGFQRDNHAEIHPVTLRGTAMHDAAETGDTSSLSLPESECVQLVDAFTTHLQEGRPNALIQTEVKLETRFPEIWGYCDWLLVEGRKGIIVDYKFGYKLVEEPENNPQAVAYTLGLFLREPQVEEIEFYFLIPRCDAILHHVFRRADLPWMELRLETIRARWLDPDKSYHPQPNLCEYCGFRAKCPALMNKALPLAAKYQGDQYPLPVEVHSSAITDPLDMAKALKLASLLDKWVESVKRHALAMRLEQGIEITGYELAERAGRRSVTNLLAAWDIAQDAGVPLDDFLQACDVSLPKLEDLYASKAPTRKKAEWKRLLADRLTDREAITSGAPVRYLKQINN